MFAELVEDFEKGYVPNLATPTRSKYASLLRCHVKPAFASLQVKEITTRVIDQFLAGKAHEGLSCLALRNLISSIFQQKARRRTGIFPTVSFTLF